ncbi:MAG TPA: VOC family protein [Beijerinckiaceae bacterium]
MSTKVFVNLPVKDLQKSMAFFEALGFTFNPQFTNDNAACMVISEHNYAMLLRHEFFKGFVTKPIADAHNSTEVLIALGLESRAAVDGMVAKAVKAGGKEPRPMQDHGFMVQRTFEDLDGHIWEAFWMDPAHVQK